ncbi:MAG: pyrroline-5-carboxylate reductase [Alphaproteobacteria bacterium]|nr:pyrroline-5-carboxylate reductase [Alphaproteobacteria bacterium]
MIGAQAGPLVLLGAGKMGTALARGWIKAGFAAENLTLVDPQPADAVLGFAREFAISLVETVPDRPARALVVAVKPQQFPAAAAKARRAVNGDTTIVSIAAGISISSLEAAFGTGRVVRTMPNTPALVGKGATGIVAGDRAGKEDRDLAGELMAVTGKVVWLDHESLLDAVTALSGSGPAYFFLMVEAMAAAGVELGLEPETAMILARQTLVGAGALVDAEDTPPDELRRNVTSKDGVTAAALEVLMGEDGVALLMARALAAGAARSRDLGL